MDVFSRPGTVSSMRQAAPAAGAKAAAAQEHAARALPVIRELQATSTSSLSGIARELTRQGVATPRGAGAWQAVQDARVLKAVGE